MKFQTFVKTINKQINRDFKNLSNWVNANKTSLYVEKQLDHELEIKLNGKSFIRLIKSNILEFMLIKVSSENIV